MSHELPEHWTPLQTAFYQTVHDYQDPKTGARGGNALGPKLGKSGRTVSNEANPDVPGHKPGIEDTVTVQLITHDYRTLHAYNAALHFVAIPLPDHIPAPDSELLEKLTAWQSRMGKTMQEVHDSFDPDGPSGRDVTKAEAAAIRQRFYSQVQAGLEFLSRIDSLAEAVDGS